MACRGRLSGSRSCQIYRIFLYAELMIQTQKGTEAEGKEEKTHEEGKTEGQEQPRKVNGP